MLYLQQKVLCKRHLRKILSHNWKVQRISNRLTDKIPVIFHNLKGYDCHFIMQTIGEIAHKHTYKYKKGEEKQMAIPNIMETCMAFMLGKHLVFIDSLQFMNSTNGCF